MVGYDPTTFRVSGERSTNWATFRGTYYPLIYYSQLVRQPAPVKTFRRTATQRVLFATLEY